MDEVEDKRRAAVEMRRALGDLTVSKDIVVTTHDEIAHETGKIRCADAVGSDQSTLFSRCAIVETSSVSEVLRAALREGKIVHERL